MAQVRSGEGAVDSAHRGDGAVAVVEALASGDPAYVVGRELLDAQVAVDVAGGRQAQQRTARREPGAQHRPARCGQPCEAARHQARQRAEGEPGDQQGGGRDIGKAEREVALDAPSQRCAQHEDGHACAQAARARRQRQGQGRDREGGQQVARGPGREGVELRRARIAGVGRARPDEHADHGDRRPQRHRAAAGQERGEQGAAEEREGSGQDVEVEALAPAE